MKTKPTTSAPMQRRTSGKIYTMAPQVRAGAPLKPSVGLSGEVPRPRDGKRRGQVAELAFMHKAADLGFAVTKPYGDSESYDFILDSGRRLWRVQVKSTETIVRRRHRYYVQPGHCNASHGRKNYTAREIDFLVAYVVPALTWYIIPVHALGSRAAIYLYPDSPNSRGRFEPYREAWCLMACPRHGRPRSEIAVSLRCDSCPVPQPRQHD